VAATTKPGGPITQVATLGLALVILVFGIVQLTRGDVWGALYGVIAVILVARSVRALLELRASRGAVRRHSYRDVTSADRDD
jgi:hypothetical protein